jgi:hypothetical protein
MIWYDIKEAIKAVSGLSQDALHIYFGVALLLIAARLLKRPAWDPLPWAIVAAAALINEAQDFRTMWRVGRTLEIGSSIRDVVNTLVLPTAMLLRARYRRRRDAAINMLETPAAPPAVQ